MSTESTDVLSLYQRYVLGTYSPSILLVRGEGTRVWDEENNCYLDFGAGISVCNLGHCHPRVVRAIQEQAARLLHVSNLFYNENQPILAEKIAEHSMEGRVFFCNSGAEANEGLIKFARRWGHQRGCTEIICMEGCFHGRTLATLAATGRPELLEGFQPNMSGFKHVPFNDLQAVKNAVSDQTAAVLIEPVQGEGGIRPADKRFMQKLRKFCDENNLLLMFDEVQCGMGRTGQFFAYQHYGIQPDALALAKSLGNGFPIGAFEVREKYADVLPPGSHATTFGGTPLACAAGIATFEVLEEEGLLENCRKLGDKLRQELKKLQQEGAPIKEVRGMGLMIGADLDVDVTKVMQEARKQQLLVLKAGSGTLRLLPPLTITRADVDQAMAVLRDVLLHKV